MSYQYINSSEPNAIIIIRTSDNANIPTDSANKDYVEYLEWVALGNTATEIDTGANYVAPSDSEIMFTMEVI